MFSFFKSKLIKKIVEKCSLYKNGIIGILKKKTQKLYKINIDKNERQDNFLKEVNY